MHLSIINNEFYDELLAVVWTQLCWNIKNKRLNIHTNGAIVCFSSFKILLNAVFLIITHVRCKVLSDHIKTVILRY